MYRRVDSIDKSANLGRCHEIQEFVGAWVGAFLWSMLGFAAFGAMGVHVCGRG